MKDLITYTFSIACLLFWLFGFYCGNNYNKGREFENGREDVIKNSYYTIYPTDTIRVKKDHNYTIICE